MKGQQFLTTGARCRLKKLSANQVSASQDRRQQASRLGSSFEVKQTGFVVAAARWHRFSIFAPPSRSH
jgi:hypothetical protein